MVMNLYLADYAAQHRMETLRHEAEQERLAAHAAAADARPSTVRQRLSRTAGRVRLVRRGSAA
jgi:hypothetical protein